MRTSKVNGRFVFFQSLEKGIKKVPIIGTFSGRFSNHWKIVGAGLLALWLGVSAGYAQIQEDFIFSEEDVGVVESDGFVLLTLKNGVMPSQLPGTPAVPARFINILLPEGETFTSLDVRAKESLFMQDAMLYPAQPPSRPGIVHPFVPPNDDAYASDEPLPVDWAEMVAVQKMRGRSMVTIRLNPLRYHPAAREVWLAQNLSITVQSKAVRGLVAQPSAQSVYFRQFLNGAVVNPEPATRGDRGISNAVPYIIITKAGLTNAFTQLANYRAQKFTNGTEIVAVEDIYASYPGRDQAEQVRNYIIGAVSNKEAFYVVLGGDDTIVPARYSVVDMPEEGISQSLPVDLYYSGLDGDWDANGNSQFGELLDENGQTVDEADLAADVIVSRIPVRTAQEVTNYVNKLMAYETGSCSNLYGKMLLSGTEAWNQIYGSDRGTDSVYDSYPPFRDHQPASDAEIWVRRIFRDFVQPYWSASVLDIYFDSLTSWDSVFAGDYEQTGDRFVEAYDQGWEFHHYSTHGDWNLYGLEDHEAFTRENAAALTNLTCFIATDACLTGYFDGPNDPCLAEAFIRGEAGALIYHGCSRYGLGAPYPDYYSGPSSAYIAKYYGHIFAVPAASIGDAYALGKMDLSGQCHAPGSYRWLQFGINLFGDPAITVRSNALPPAPKMVAAGMTNLPANGMYLQWSHEADSPVGFDVQRMGGTDEVWRIIGSMDSGITNYVDSTISNGVFYAYRVRATNEAGHSIWSGPLERVAGTLDVDAWDPVDDTSAGATALPAFSATYTNHGPHTLSMTDTNDWFSFAVTNDRHYQFSTYYTQNKGGLHARLYDEGMNWVTNAGSLEGNEPFALYFSPDSTGIWRLCVEPDQYGDSAAYKLFFRMEELPSDSSALGTALESTQLVWQTSSGAQNPWVAQTNTFKFGSSAAQSGVIYQPEDLQYPDAGYSAIETRFEATPPVVCYYWLKADLEPDVYLSALDGTSLSVLTESIDWTQRQFVVTGEAATNVAFNVNLAANHAVEPGNSCVWLDHVEVITSADMMELGMVPVTNTLSAGLHHVYKLTLEGSGYHRLELTAPAGITLSVSDDAWNPMGVVVSENRFRWLIDEPGVCYITLYNTEDHPAGYGMQVSPDQCRTYCVDASGTNAVLPYTNWSIAATSIQDAVDLAVEGELVLITNGEYRTGGVAVNEITNRVYIHRDITVRSVNGPSHTTIFGSGSMSADAVRGVWMTAGMLSGLAIEAGCTQSNGVMGVLGGGAWLEQKAMMSNCWISGCTAYRVGGGVYFNKGGTLYDCTLSSNRAFDSGGGAYMDGGLIERSTVVSNYSETGGGAYLVDGAEMRNCAIAHNDSGLAGGVAIQSTEDNTAMNLLINCTVMENTAATNGGVQLAGCSEMINCIVYSNTAGGSISEYVIEGTNSTAAYCCTNNPLLDASSHDYYLSSSSPCINAGTQMLWMSTGTDLSGNSRLIGSTVDIGAREYLLAPTDLVAATNALGSRLAVSWSAVTGAVNYVIYRSTNNVLPSQTLAASTNALYYDSSALHGQVYYYWVTACYGVSTGSVSTSVQGWLREGMPLSWLYLLLK